jgi:hypothetical protein
MITRDGQPAAFEPFFIWPVLYFQIILYNFKVYRLYSIDIIIIIWY